MPGGNPQPGEMWVRDAMVWIVEQRGHLVRIPEPHLPGDHVLVRRARDKTHTQRMSVEQFLRDYEFVSEADDD